MNSNRHPLLELLLNPPASDEQQPALERADRRVVFEPRYLPGHDNNRLLHDILRLGVGQAGFDGHAIDESAVRVEELLPTFLVVPVLEPAEQTAAGWDEVVVVHECGTSGYSPSQADSYNAVQLNAGDTQKEFREP